MRRAKGILVFLVMGLSVIVAACGGGTEATVVAPTATSAPLGATSVAPTARPTVAPTAVPAPTATSIPVPTGRFRFSISLLNGYALLPGVAFVKAHVDPMYDALLGQAADGQLSPQSGFASSWQSSPDGNTWTLKVRDGVLFHNGDKATANDFKFSLEFYVSPDALVTGSGSTTRARYLDHVEAPDNSTVVVSFKAFNLFAALDTFALTGAGSSGYLLPKTYIQGKTAKEANKSPVGSGPYKYKSDVSNQQLELEAVNAAHWLLGMPRYATAQVTVIPEDATRVALIKAGQAESIEAPRPNVSEFQKSGIDVVTSPAVGRMFDLRLHDQFRPGPFSDMRVREALSLAVDRKVLVEKFLYGIGQPSMEKIVTPPDPAYKVHPVPNQDLARAKSLLIEAGYPNGFNVDLYMFGSRGIAVETPQISEAISVWWESIGLKVTRKPTDATSLLPLIGKHDQPGPYASTGWASGFPGHVAGIPPGTTIRDVVLRDTEDPDFEQAGLGIASARTMTEYVAAAQKQQELYIQRALGVPLFHFPEIYAVRAGLGGSSWNLGRGTFNINLAALLTRPNVVR